MSRTRILETKEVNVPRIICRLFAHINSSDDSESGSPKITPKSLLNVYGTIDDFRLPYPLSRGAELTINKLPLGIVERLKIEDNRES